MFGFQHSLDAVLHAYPWVAQKTGHAAKCLIGLGIKDVKNRSGEQRRAGLHPMVVKPFAIRIHNHVDNVLNVFRFVVRADSHLFDRIVLNA